MGRPRKFDRGEAARLYAEHGTYTVVARILGVSAVSVRRALDPAVQERVAEYQRRRRAWIGVCGDCGGPAANAYPSRRRTVCRACRAERSTKSARPDALRCSLCRIWLPDEDFPFSRGAGGTRYAGAVRLCNAAFTGTSIPR